MPSKIQGENFNPVLSHFPQPFSRQHRPFFPTSVLDSTFRTFHHRPRTFRLCRHQLPGILHIAAIFRNLLRIAIISGSAHQHGQGPQLLSSCWSRGGLSRQGLELFGRKDADENPEWQGWLDGSGQIRTKDS